MAVSNFNKLVIAKMAREAIPDDDGLADVIAFLNDPQRMARVAREAEAWVKVAIVRVKSAPDNQYGDDDEAIAGEILRWIGENKSSRKTEP